MGSVCIEAHGLHGVGAETDQNQGTINKRKGKSMPKIAKLFYWWVNYKELP